MVNFDLDKLKSCDIKTIDMIKKGEHVYTQGEEANSFYYIHQGLVALYHCVDNGKESLIRLYSENEFFGYRTLLGGKLYHCSAKALQDTYLVKIKPYSVDTFLKDNASLIRYLIFNLCSELQDAESRLAKTAFIKSQDRVIESTEYLKQKCPNYKWTYREIAQYAGCETETTIRLSKAIKKS